MKKLILLALIISIRFSAQTTNSIGVSQSAAPTIRLAGNLITEASEARTLQRVVVNSSLGSEINIATSAKQDTSNVKLTNLYNIASTSAKQDTSNAKLSNIYNIVSTSAKQDTIIQRLRILDSTGIGTKQTRDYTLASRYYESTINPTVGTGVAIGIAAQNAYAVTAPNILIRATTKPVILDKINLLVTGAGTSLTALQVAIVIDTTNRYSSGGTLLTTKDIYRQTLPTAVSYVGTTAIVATAAGTGTDLIYRGVIKSAIPAINDYYTLDFGKDNLVEQNGTNITRVHLKCPSIVVPPRGSVLIYIWGPGQTVAPTFEGQIYTIE